MTSVTPAPLSGKLTKQIAGSNSANNSIANLAELSGGGRVMGMKLGSQIII